MSEKKIENKHWGRPKGALQSEEVKKKISEGVKKSYLEYKEKLKKFEEQNKSSCKK